MNNPIKILARAANALRGRYLQSSIRILEGSGRFGAKRPDFNIDYAVNKEFGSWVYAATMLNANAVSSTPLRLYQRKPEGSERSVFRSRAVPSTRKRYLMGDGLHKPYRDTCRKIIEFGDDFEEVTDQHPILDLLRKVNPWYNGFDIMQLLTIYLELTGNAYWHPVIDPDTGVPEEIWPMPSQWVQVIPSREEFISGYAYGQRTDQMQEFGVDEVIHFRTSSPGNNGLFYGKGKIEAGWGAVSLNDSNHTMDIALAENQGRPDYAVIFKSGVGNDQLDRFQKQIDSEFKGVKRSGKTMTMAGDVTLTPLNFPPKDMGGRDDVVEEIAAIWGTPVSLLKANDPNLASSKIGYAQWRESGVLPTLRLIEQKLNEQLLPMFGIEDDAVLAFDNPVPADKEFELREATELARAGIKTHNEVREDRGMERSEDPNADKLLVNGQPLGAAASPFSFLSSEPRQPVAMVDTSGSRSWTGWTGKTYAITASGASTAKCFDQSDFLYDKSCACHTKVDSSQDIRDEQPSAPESRLRQAIAEVLERVSSDINQSVSKSIRPHITTKISSGDIEKILARIAAMEGQLEGAMFDSLADMIGAGGLAGLGKIDIEGAFDVSNPKVEQFVRSQTTLLAGELTANTRGRVERVLQEGIAQGTSNRDIQAMIEETGAFSSHRAEAIARTESANAYVQGEKESWRQSDIVKGVRWDLAPNACEFCRAVAAAFDGKVQPLDAPFLKLGDTVTGTDGGKLNINFRKVDGPPLHPNDRCDLVPVIESGGS